MLRRALILLSLVYAAPLAAHEYWLQPLDYTVGPGDTIEGHLRNGDGFKGAAFSYLPQKFRRFDAIQNGQVTPVPGRAGDMPALSWASDTSGLVTFAYVTTDTFITYREWEKFVGFLDHKDAMWVIDEHKARGLSATPPIRERYSRYVKALVAVGHGQGADVEVGLEVEIVALDNPFTADLSEGMAVQAFYQGAPRADAQIELFERAPDGTIEVTLHRTDADGIVRLPVRERYEYLVDHVVLRPIAPDDDAAVWESLWAALTFGIPPRQ